MFSGTPYPTLPGHLHCPRHVRLLGGSTEERVFDRRIVDAVLAVARLRRGSRSGDLAYARVHDLEVGVVEQCLQVCPRETPCGICEAVKVDVGRYGDLSRVRLQNLFLRRTECQQGERLSQRDRGLITDACLTSRRSSFVGMLHR